VGIYSTFEEMRQSHVVGELGICAEKFLAGAAFTLQPLRVLRHPTRPMLHIPQFHQWIPQNSIFQQQKDKSSF
jgi:hypothetical protein